MHLLIDLPPDLIRCWLDRINAKTLYAIALSHSRFAHICISTRFNERCQKRLTIIQRGELYSSPAINRRIYEIQRLPNGRKHGTEIYWYPATGTLAGVCRYSHDERDGIDLEWYRSGSPKFVCNWNEGHYHAFSMRCYDDE